MAAAAIERINVIFGRLKRFACLDEAEFQRVDLHEGIETTLALLAATLDPGIEVERRFDKSLPQLPCYPSDLNQVFYNLLLNAAQAIQGAGCIVVRTFADRDRICVEISDSGAGIEPARLERIFQPRLSSHGSRVKAGIGLFTAARLVARQGGEIVVRSEVGRGSTFTVRLLPHFVPPSSDGGADRSSAPLDSTERCARMPDG